MGISVMIYILSVTYVEWYQIQHLQNPTVLAEVGLTFNLSFQPRIYNFVSLFLY
jgi:hypothetical protein